MAPTWHTDPTSGLVTVDFGDGAGPHEPTLSPKEFAAFKSKVLDRWGQLIAQHAAIVDIPAAFLAGLIWRESGGNPDVISFDHGVGLMQITSKVLRAGHSDEELKNPELNVDIGSKYFAGFVHDTGGDLPKSAAGYNAGHIANCSPNVKSCNKEWDLIATPGHISGVVSASNSAILSKWNPELFPNIHIDLPPIEVAGVAPSNSKNIWGFAAAAGFAFLTIHFLRGTSIPGRKASHRL